VGYKAQGFYGFIDLAEEIIGGGVCSYWLQVHLWWENLLEIVGMPSKVVLLGL
jgi:hypothetical protein